MMRLLLTGLAGLCLVLTGCSTHAHRLVAVREAYHSGDLATAQTRIDKAARDYPREADVLELDRASVLLSEGQVRQAEQILRQVRDRLDQKEGTDLQAGLTALLTDDQNLQYAGEDHEKVLLRFYLALANLLGDGSDAAAYALQVADKQQQIIQAGTGPDGKNPKASYGQVAAGAYLHAVLREETQQHYDDAARSLQLVCHWSPQFVAGKRDLERVKTGRHSHKGNGVLYVFALVGRGPYKEEKLEVPSTVALLLADRLLSDMGKRSLPPTVAPIKVPRLVVPPSEVQTVRVSAAGQVGQTETLTDVGQLARQQCEAIHDSVVARAVARRAVKKAAIFGVKEALRLQKDQLSNLALDLAGVVWEATESADTRCWGLLPDKIQVLRLELPAGTHSVSVQPIGHHGRPVGSPVTTNIEIRDGRNSYALAHFPTGRLVGRIVCSGQEAAPVAPSEATQK